MKTGRIAQGVRPLKAARRDRLAEALHLQAIEANPLSPDEVAMFEMFEREGWTPDDRRAYIVRELGHLKRFAAVE